MEVGSSVDCFRIGCGARSTFGLRCYELCEVGQMYIAMLLKCFLWENSVSEMADRWEAACASLSLRPAGLTTRKVFEVLVPLTAVEAAPELLLQPAPLPAGYEPGVQTRNKRSNLFCSVFLLLGDVVHT